MKAFLAIKYYEDMRNKNLIESICQSFESQNIEMFAFARDIQKYGPCNLTEKETVEIAFEKIKSSDVFIIDASELSIGIGIETGVAYSNNIPIYLVANKEAYVSNFIKGVAKKSYFYSLPQELSGWNIFD